MARRGQRQYRSGGKHRATQWLTTSSGSRTFVSLPIIGATRAQMIKGYWPRSFAISRSSGAGHSDLRLALSVSGNLGRQELINGCAKERRWCPFHWVVLWCLHGGQRVLWFRIMTIAGIVRGCRWYADAGGNVMSGTSIMLDCKRHGGPPGSCLDVAGPIDHDERAMLSGVSLISCERAARPPDFTLL